MDTSTQSRHLAVGMLQAGKSPAETWEALVSSGMDSGAAEALVKELVETQRAANNAAGQPAIYLTAEEHHRYLTGFKTGNFWLGFLAGFFCSCFSLAALLFWDDMGTETKKGIKWGVVIGLIWVIVVNLIIALLRH